MRVSASIVAERRKKLALLLATHRYLPVREICGQLGVSEATARRDLAALAHEHVVTRTYGGALTEFDARFPSFSERDFTAREAKQQLAMKAAKLVTEGATLYLDAGTTVAAVARSLADRRVRGLRILTCSLPAAEVLAEAGTDVHLTGGQMLARQSTLLGDEATASVRRWTFDLAFVSAEGADTRGLWNSNTGIVTMQLTAKAQSKEWIVCLDSKKLQRAAPAFLLGWDAAFLLISDASPEKLHALGYKGRIV